MQHWSSEVIYETLESEIINLKLRPGTTLNEAELCKRFGVSRTPIRAALQRLKNNGLIDITPYKGITVTLLDFGIINQIIYQRVAVESMVVRDFTKICTPLLVEKLRYLIRSQRVLISGEFSTAEFYALDSQLHEVWFAETQKPYLWQCIQSAQSNYSRFRMLDIVEAQGFDAIVSEHELLLDIITKQRYDQIEPLFVKHLYGGVMRLGELVYTDLKGYFIQK